MDELKSALGKALRDNDREEVNRLINDFAASYPHVGGLDALKHDVAQYDTLVRLVDNKELQEVVRLSRTVKFRTPIFEDYVGGWLASTLPPADIVAKYAAAADAWRSGKGDEAIAMLEPLTDQPWGEVAAGQIERYRKIGADYETLLASKGGARYWDNLLALWGSLRPQEDEYVLRQLQPDFIAHKEEMLPRLEESYRRVRTSWDAYQRAGGIPGVIRVEGHVSAKFTEQARRLSSAYEEITSGAQTIDPAGDATSGLAGAGRTGRERSAAAATLASGPEHCSRADAAQSKTGSSAPDRSRHQGTVYYRSRRD